MWEAKYRDDRVGLSVCLSFVPDHTSGTTRPIFIKFYAMHVTYVRGSVLLWWLCDTLCTSGFTDDVIFAHNEAYAGCRRNTETTWWCSRGPWLKQQAVSP